MPAARKVTTKTAGKTATGRPFAKGNDPRRGGGKPGRSGRKPLAFVQACSELVDADVLDKVRAYLADAKAGPADPAWRWCAEYVSTYSKAKPAQSMKVSGEEGGVVSFTMNLGAAAVVDPEDA